MHLTPNVRPTCTCQVQGWGLLAFIPWHGVLTPISNLGFSMEELFSGTTRPLTVETLCEELKPWQIETGKAAFLDYLYELYDRDNAEIGLRGTYTGLWDRFKNDTAMIMQAGFITTGEL